MYIHMYHTIYIYIYARLQHIALYRVMTAVIIIITICIIIIGSSSSSSSRNMHYNIHNKNGNYYHLRRVKGGWVVWISLLLLRLKQDK